MEHFLPLFALGPSRYPDQVQAFLRLGKVPLAKVQAAETFLAAKGDHRNALWLLLLPYGFAAIRKIDNSRLCTALARASEVRAICTPSSTPALQQALMVLHGAAAELVPGYCYGTFTEPFARQVMASTLKVASRTEELGGADCGCVKASVLKAAMEEEPLLDGLQEEARALLGLGNMVQQLLHIVQQLD